MKFKKILIRTVTLVTAITLILNIEPLEKVTAEDYAEENVLVENEMAQDMSILKTESTAGDFCYKVNQDGESVTITDYIGKGRDVVIPTAIEGMQVTEIGPGAFAHCDSLTSVTIPDCVRYIDMGAFERCTNLTTVSMPKGNVYLEYWAFSECKNIQSLTLPRKLYISPYTFSDSKIKDIYYGGTETEWEAISTQLPGNDAIFEAKIHYALQNDEMQFPKIYSNKNTASTEYSGSNIGNNNYLGNYSRCVSSYLTQTSDGFMRVQFGAVDSKILVEYYTDKYVFKSSKLVDYELPLFGGFYETENNYYVLSGQTNENEDNSVEVCRVTKYDKNWERLDSASLVGANTTIPFYAGSARMAHKDNKLVVRTCHEMYKSWDGRNHQANLTFIVDTDIMEITDSLSSVSNIYIGYCSHSFNQFVHVDGNHIVAADHGDAYPRSVVLCIYESDISTGELNKVFNYNMFPISGQTGDNYTGVQVGGFEFTDSAYITAGTSINQENENSNISNIFVSSLNSNSETCEINFITDYSEEGAISAANPQLIKINDEELILLWQAKTNSRLIKDTVYYTFLDKTGKQTGEIKRISGNLSDCKPIICGDSVVWYTWDDNTVTFISLSYKNQISIVSGDVNDDTKISTADARWILQYASGKRPLTDLQKAVADVNEDGKVNTADAKWVLQAASGKRPLK